MGVYKTQKGIEKAFWDRVQKSEGCWKWIGRIGSTGYGEFYLRGRDVGAHRFMFTLKNGAIPDGMIVMHTCDNPCCVRPDHLRLGTHSLNALDREAKKRGNQPRGENRRMSKLTEDAVRFILDKFSKRHPELGQCGLARRFGVSRGAVQQVLKGRTWSHVKEAATALHGTKKGVL